MVIIMLRYIEDPRHFEVIPIDDAIQLEIETWHSNFQEYHYAFLEFLLHEAGDDTFANFMNEYLKGVEYSESDGNTVYVIPTDVEWLASYSRERLEREFIVDYDLPKWQEFLEKYNGEV